MTRLMRYRRTSWTFLKSHEKWHGQRIVISHHVYAHASWNTDVKRETWILPQGVVIRQKKAWRRREGVFVYFEDAACPWSATNRWKIERVLVCPTSKAWRYSSQGVHRQQRYSNPKKDGAIRKVKSHPIFCMHPVWSKFSFYTQPYHCSQDNAGVIVNDKGEMKGSAIQARSERFHVGLPMRGVCTSVPNIHRFITTVPRWASHVRRTPGPCGEGMRRAVAENCLLRTGHLLSSRIPRSRWGPARKERWMGTLGWPLLVTSGDPLDHWAVGVGQGGWFLHMPASSDIC